MWHDHYCADYVDANQYMNTKLSEKRRWFWLFLYGRGRLTASADNSVIFDYISRSIWSYGVLDFFDGKKEYSIRDTKKLGGWTAGMPCVLKDKISEEILAVSTEMPRNSTQIDDLVDYNCFEVKTPYSKHYIHAKYKVMRPVPFINFELINEPSRTITLQDENDNIIMSGRPFGFFDGITLHQKCEEVNVLLPLFFSYTARSHLLMHDK